MEESQNVEIVIKPFPEKFFQNLKKEFPPHISETFLKLLSQRNIETLEQAREYISHTIKNLHNPFLMKGMTKAVERIIKSIKDSEPLLIIGDYDVDGVTSVSCLLEFLRHLNAKVSFHIPDRHTEGYGVSDLAIEKAIEQNIKLIISVDCGITSHRQIEKATNSGIDFIVCDHHLPEKTLPKAFAILDAKQPGCKYPFKELSACGVVFKLMQALAEKQDIASKHWLKYIDLVMVSTTCDIVSMTGENRTITHLGLKKFNRNPNFGLKKLKHISGIKHTTSVRDIIFSIGPRINSLGRIKTADKGVQLLTTQDELVAKQLSEEVNNNNSIRRDLDQDYTRLAIHEVRNQNLKPQEPLVYFGKNFNKGIVGITAARLVEAFGRPAIVFSDDGSESITGSARSIESVNIYEILCGCSDFIERFGGHKAAAGLTIRSENKTLFKERFKNVMHEKTTPKDFIPKHLVDAPLSLDEINDDFYKLVMKLGPFGPENMSPTFLDSDIKMLEPPRIINDEHLKLYVFNSNPKKYFEALYFGGAKHIEMLEKAIKIDICFKMHKDFYYGIEKINLRIDHICTYF